LKLLVKRLLSDCAILNSLAECNLTPWNALGMLRVMD